MPPDPRHFLRCLSDAFTTVRDESGRLLGCVPRIADGTEGYRGTRTGTIYPVGLVAVAAIMAPTGSQPSADLPGFIPLDQGQHADLALPPIVEQP